jgi:hypothetical protein
MDLVDSLRNADTFTKLDLQNAYGNNVWQKGTKKNWCLYARRASLPL